MSTPWASRPVFLSSTFRDIHAERDHLRDVVYPSLEEDLRERRHHLEPIDLRWIVETVSLDRRQARQGTAGAEGLPRGDRTQSPVSDRAGGRTVLLDSSRRAHAGREAGFTGDVAGKSVTALEIAFGALSSPDQLSRTWFYFRDPLQTINSDVCRRRISVPIPHAASFSATKSAPKHQPRCHNSDCRNPRRSRKLRRDQSRLVRSLLDQRRPSPSVGRVGSHISRFADCSAFTHVMACVFAASLKEPFPRVLQSRSLPH